MSGGTLTGPGTVTVTGLTTWTGGTMSGSGTTNANGGMTIGDVTIASQMYLDQRTLNNSGAATLADFYYFYGLSFSSGATFNNEAGGSFSFISDASMVNGGGTPGGGTFVNAGTLSKTGGSGTSIIYNGITLNSTGTIEADSGTVSMRGGGTLSSAASLTANAGANLDFGGGTFVAPAGSSISGSGVTAVISFSGASVVINGSYVVGAGLTSVEWRRR